MYSEDKTRTESFIHSFIQSFNQLLIYPLLYEFDEQFIYCFVQACINFTHQYTISTVNSAYQRLQIMHLINNSGENTGAV